MIRVLVVDDQPMIRAGLRAILDPNENIEVVADVADGLAALEAVTRLEVDVVLLDLRMPGIDGVETTRRLRERHDPQELRIVILTTFDQDDNVLAALHAGADGFLGKAATPAELAGALHDVAAGGGALSGSATKLLIDRLMQTKPAPVDADLARRFGSLTAREHEVVVRIAQGRTNEEIGNALFLSPFTVKTHANRAMTKVGARDRAQLTAFAHLSGLAELSMPNRLASDGGVARSDNRLP